MDIKPILKNRKGAMLPKQVLFAMSFVAVTLTLLSQSGYINLGKPGEVLKDAVASITGSTSGGYIERPIFYYDKCEAVGSLSYSQDYSVASSGSWIQKPSATDQYNLKIKWQYGIPTIYSYRIKYSICNSQINSAENCRVFETKQTTSSPTGEISVTNIKPTESVWIVFERGAFGISYGTTSGAKYQVGFIPFGIRQYNVLGGSANAINPNSCTYSSKQTDTIISSDSGKVNSYKPASNINEQTLDPNEVRWYLAGYVSGAAPSFALSYSGQEAWCRPNGANAEIYKINKITTPSGTYKIASIDWNDKIGTEICCPGQVNGDKVCSSSFAYQTIAGYSPGSFGTCGSSNWVPYDAQTIIKYSKNNDGICVSETQKVDCASNLDCKDSNQLCDTNQWKCVNANVNLNGQVIFTIPDNPTDCANKGGTWITQTTEKKSFLNFLGIGTPKVVVTEYCQLKKSFNWVFWIALTAFLLLIFVFRSRVIAGFRWILAKIGVKI